MALPAGLRALGHRDFRLFWCGQLVSLVGTWMQSVGQSWLVLELTNSPFRLGLIGALPFWHVAMLAALAAIRTEGAPRPGRGLGMRAEIAEGVRYAAGTPRVALVMGLLMVVSLFVANMNVLVPLIARDVLSS